MALTDLIQNPNQPPPMPVSLAGMGSPMPQLPPQLAPLVTSPREQQIQGLEQKIAAYQNPAKPQGFWQNLGHVAARIGNIAGDIVAPSEMALIPGTMLNRAISNSANQRELAGLHAADRADSTEASQNALRSAQTAETAERTAEMPGAAASENALKGAQADAITNPKPEIHDTPMGLMAIDKTNATATPVTAHGVAIGPKLETDVVPGIIGADGKPHTYLVTKKGEKIADLGEHYEKPVVNVSGENHQFQEQERGRGLLDAAEKQYRTAQQSANTMRDMLASANAGNKMSAQMLPLEGALAITTSQGVHRINRTEVDQFAGGGSLYDKVASEISKIGAGLPIDASVRTDIAKLTDIQDRAAYKNYHDAFKSATTRYGLKDEKPIEGPKMTATGPGGHQIVSTDGGDTWVDPQTGKEVK